MSLTLGVLVAMQSAVAAASENHAAAQYRAEGFTFLLPQGVRIVKRTPVHDFDLYEFLSDGKPILHAYVGNAPDVKAKLLKEGRDVKLHEKGYSIRSVTTKGVGGVSSREVLVVFSSREKGWPLYVHYWYDHLSTPMAKVADAIVDSTEPTVVEPDPKDVKGK